MRAQTLALQCEHGCVHVLMCHTCIIVATSLSLQPYNAECFFFTFWVFVANEYFSGVCAFFLCNTVELQLRRFQIHLLVCWLFGTFCLLCAHKFNQHICIMALNATLWWQLVQIVFLAFACMSDAQTEFRTLSSGKFNGYFWVVCWKLLCAFTLKIELSGIFSYDGDWV